MISDGAVWSFILAAVGILGIWLAGRKNLWGWALGVSAQVLWIVFAVVTQQWGFILSAIAYGAVYGWNWWKWAHERRGAPTTYCKTLRCRFRYAYPHADCEVSHPGTPDWKDEAWDLWDEIAAGPADDDDLSPRRAP